MIASQQKQVRPGSLCLMNLRNLALSSFHDLSSQIYLQIFGSTVSLLLICTAVMHTERICVKVYTQMRNKLEKVADKTTNTI